jgi:hypothetical protein
MPVKRTYIYYKCGACLGTGVINIDDGTPKGQNIPCTACSGTGQVKGGELINE